MFRAPFGSKYRTPWVMIVVGVIGLAASHYIQTYRDELVKKLDAQAAARTQTVKSPDSLVVTPPKG